MEKSSLAAFYITLGKIWKFRKEKKQNILRKEIKIYLSLRFIERIISLQW